MLIGKKNVIRDVDRSGLPDHGLVCGGGFRPPSSAAEKAIRAKVDRRFHIFHVLDLENRR